VRGRLQDDKLRAVHTRYFSGLRARRSGGRLRSSAGPFRRQQRHQDIRLHPRADFDQSVFGNFLQQTLHFSAPNFLMGHFAPAMKNHRLDFMAIPEKPDDLVFADLVIVFGRRGPEFYFLQLRTFLMLALLVRFLIGLVKIFSVVGNLTNRRVRRGRNFHQIEAPLPSKLDRLEWRHHPELPAIFVHDANFSRPNPIVYPDPVCLPKTPFRDKPTSPDCACPADNSLALHGQLCPAHSRIKPTARECGRATKYSTPGRNANSATWSVGDCFVSKEGDPKAIYFAGPTCESASILGCDTTLEVSRKIFSALLETARERTNWRPVAGFEQKAGSAIASLRVAAA